MRRLLKSKNNVNYNIFTIPSEEGGIDEDNYMASIGDASSNHIQSLSHSDRQVWEDFQHYIQPDSGIFRLEENPFYDARDPFDIKKLEEEELEGAFQEQIKKAYKEGYLDDKTSEELLKIFKSKKIQSIEEIFDTEKVRRQELAEESGIGDISSYYTAVSYEEWRVVKDQILSNKSNENPEDDHGDVNEERFDADNHYINNEPIPYDQWQHNPQLWAHWDIESTPKIRSIYSGEADTFFYDDMPQGHPNIDFINNLFRYMNKPLEQFDIESTIPFLQALLNRDWTYFQKETNQQINENPEEEKQPKGYNRTFLSLLKSQFKDKEVLSDNVHSHLEWLLMKLNHESQKILESNHKDFLNDFQHVMYKPDASSEDKEKFIDLPRKMKFHEDDYPDLELFFTKTLQAIENDYRSKYIEKTLEARDENIIHNILTSNEKQWEAQHKLGNSPYKEIKAFGKMLHNELNSEMKKASNKERKAIWSRYYYLKRKYCPMIIYQNIDINKASPNEIMKAINTINFTKEDIGHIINNRPFDNFGDIFWEKWFTSDKLTNNEFVKGVMDLFTNKIEQAFDKKDFSILSKEAQILKAFQNSEYNDISKSDWESIWSFYRVTKATLTNLNSDAYYKELKEEEFKVKQSNKK